MRAEHHEKSLLDGMSCEREALAEPVQLIRDEDIINHNRDKDLMLLALTRSTSKKSTG